LDTGAGRHLVGSQRSDREAPLRFVERAQPLAELPESKGRRAVRAALLTGDELERLLLHAT